MLDKENILGEPLLDWQPPEPPKSTVLAGQYCLLTPMNAEQHNDALWQAFNPTPKEKTTHSLWDYLPYGPFNDAQELHQLLSAYENNDEPLFYAIVDTSNQQAIGWISYLRIRDKVGSIEIGHLAFSPRLQKTRMATEAVFLLIKHCFDLGYRRCEWKCNSLNEPSKRAAERFGFQYEGCFRQDLISKGRNRDTCWYSIIDKEWESLEASYQRWLAPSNFDSAGKQKRKLKG